MLEIEKCFEMYEHPFTDLETLHKQLNYYKSNFDFIVSSWFFCWTLYYVNFDIRNLLKLYLEVAVYGREVELREDVWLKMMVSCTYRYFRVFKHC